MISGETIRQTALERSQTCPEGMKGSFYYGFREGAKWMQNENPILKDVAEQKAIIVDTKWLEGHDKEMIWKACRYLEERLGDDLTINFVELFKLAMEEQ